MAESDEPKRVKVGLALGGGGSRGYAHLGVAKALRELGIPICCVAGTSIGSIVGGVLASDMLMRALNWAHEPDWFKLPKLFLKWHMPWRSLLGSERIEAFLRDMVCAKTFDELVMPFAAVATDLLTGDEVVMRSGDLQSAMRASMAIPGIFDPIERDGRILVDGGLVDPVPADVCRSLGAEAVIAVDINSVKFMPEPGRLQLQQLNMLDIIDQTFTVVCNGVGKGVLEKNPPDFLLKPSVGSVKMMDFRDADRLIEIGYACAMEHKEELVNLSWGRGAVKNFHPQIGDAS